MCVDSSYLCVCAGVCVREREKDGIDAASATNPFDTASQETNCNSSFASRHHGTDVQASRPGQHILILHVTLAPAIIQCILWLGVDTPWRPAHTSPRFSIATGSNASRCEVLDTSVAW